MKILVVDDEILIRNVIKEYLLIEGYNVLEASDGNEALDIINQYNVDLIILDIMMPKKDGFETIDEIKQIKDIPIIMLSARTEEFDKLKSFNLGADDYVTKPFSPKELMARIKVILKRNKNEDIIKVDNIIMDKVKRECIINDKQIELTHTQFELLYLFLTNLNIVLTREKIINSIWGYDHDALDRTIDAHIKLLRNKILTYRDNIKTIRKVGYKFEYKER